MDEKTILLFNDLEPEIRKALMLLKKRATRAIEGVGNTNPKWCPIAMAYNVQATYKWIDLGLVSKTKLYYNEWREPSYNAFIYWHDKGNEQERDFLRHYLAS